MLFKRKKAHLEGTIILFCSDLHGSTTCFKKFVNAPDYYRDRGHPVDALIMGGDMTGKLVVPILRTGGASYRAYLTGKQHELSEDELPGFIKKCETLGVYPHVFDSDEYAAFSADPVYQNELFKQLMLQRLREWIEFAEERLAGQGVFCSMMPGNDDIPEVDELLNDATHIVNADGRVVHVDDRHEMATLGVSNPTPFGCPRDIPEDDLAQRLDDLAAGVEDMERCIFNVHVPPYESGIDEAPQLDDELRPRVGPQGVEMVSVGSTAVREALLRYQPLAGLHGHIHESKGVARFGRTLCLNPGSEYSEGILRGALVKIDDAQVSSHLLISG